MIDKKKLETARSQFKECSSLFIALGDSMRQNICLELAAAGEEGINVAQLTGKSILSRPAISHHLKVLKDCGLVEPIKKGTQIFYRLHLKEYAVRIRQLIDVIDAIIIEENE